MTVSSHATSTASTITILLILLFLISNNICTITHVSSLSIVPTTIAKSSWDLYRTCLNTHPLLTKACTSSSIMSLSDTICQRLEKSVIPNLQKATVIAHNNKPHGMNCSGSLKDIKEKNETQLQQQQQQQRQQQQKEDEEIWHHNFRRTRDVAITGLIWAGPISHTWYSIILEQLVPMKTIPNRFVGLIIRLVLDATLFSPIAIFGYFTCRSVLEGLSLPQIINKLKTRWKRALYRAWKFRPIVNIVNFWLVPIQYRVLYSNLVSLVWSGYLSHMNSAKLRLGQLQRQHQQQQQQQEQLQQQTSTANDKRNIILGR